MLFPDGLDEYISAENPVRFIDAFVDSLDLTAAGFTHTTLAETGRLPYEPRDLLKLYIYGIEETQQRVEVHPEIMQRFGVQTSLQRRITT